MTRRPLVLRRAGRLATIVALLGWGASWLRAEGPMRLPPISHTAKPVALLEVESGPSLRPLSDEHGIERLPLPAPELEPVKPPSADWTPSIDPLNDAGATNPPKTQIIDLPAALRLADRANPEIGIARQAIWESLAIQQGARVLLLPSLNAGANYHNHNGNLQRSRGAILDVPAEQSLYFGAGSRTVAAESVAFPGLRIFSHLGDAIFEPLAARQQVQARNFDSRATFNSILLGVSTRYIDLMAAEAQLEFLQASRRDADEVARMTTNFARVGQAREADADRVTTEARFVDADIQRAIERRTVAGARLAELLNLDPSVELRTIGGTMPIVQLVDPKYPLADLLEIALRQRPELGARSAQIAAAETRYRQERTRPLLPTISIGFSAGDFGGGSALVSPLFGRFAGRTDFDAMAFWTAQNFGVGNAALWRTRRAQTNEAVATRLRTLNQVRAEVSEAYAKSEANRMAVEIARRRLGEAEAGFHEEFNRIRAGEGLPIELLDNLTRLISARQAIIDAIAAYDRAQFQLFVALGEPPTLALPSAGRLGVEGGQ